MASTPLPPCRHRAQAAHNRQVAQQLATISPLWGWVAAFYSAMHLVNEYASFRGQALTNHIERNDWVLHSTDLAAIRAHYKALFERSCIARYDCPPQTHYLYDAARFSREAFAWLTEIEEVITQQEALHGDSL